jgi:hypothetical protein
MNILLGTLLLFTSILMLFLGAPIGALIIASIIFPPNLHNPKQIRQINTEILHNNQELKPDIQLEVNQVLARIET